MEESIFQTFLLLAYSSVAIISVTIANYAVSASYLGRETRLSRVRMERKRIELLETLKKLKGSTQISEVNEKTQKSKKEQRNLRMRLFFLSWYGAVILPTIFFGISFVSSVIGINIDILASYNLDVQNLMILSIGGISIGALWLLFVIKAIDSAAKRIPVPKFLVSYETGLKSTKCKSKEHKEIIFSFENDGEDIAEGVLLFVHFPPEFTVHPIAGRYVVYKQRAKSEFPDYNSAIFREQLIHVGTTLHARIVLTMPEKEDSYDIPIHLYERKTGCKTDTLVIEVLE